MSVQLRHIGCKSVIIAYCGEVPLDQSPIMRSCDWAWPDGSNVELYSILMATCPDCGKRVVICKREIEPIPRLIDQLEAMVTGADYLKGLPPGSALY